VIKRIDLHACQSITYKLINNMYSLILFKLQKGSGLVILRKNVVQIVFKIQAKLMFWT